MISPRLSVIGALLPAIRSFAPGAEGCDIGFFGETADISSPVPRKFGLDITPEMVYNIVYSTKLGGVPLLKSGSCENGFLNFTVSDEALRILAEEAAAGLGLSCPADVIEVGDTPAFLHAKLLGAALTAADDLIPSDPSVRRALWQCIAADSPESVGRAVSSVSAAFRALSASGARLGRTAALAMASGVGKGINKEQHN